MDYRKKKDSKLQTQELKYHLIKLHILYSFLISRVVRQQYHIGERVTRLKEHLNSDSTSRPTRVDDVEGKATRLYLNLLSNTIKSFPPVQELAALDEVRNLRRFSVQCSGSWPLAKAPPTSITE